MTNLITLIKVIGILVIFYIMANRFFNWLDNNKLTNKFVIKHYTPSNTSTEELKKMYKNNSYNRKKEIIRKELVKRGKWEN